MASARSKVSPSKPKACLNLDGTTDDSCAALPPPPIEREDLAWYVRHHLTREERLVVMLRYAEELQFDEIAGVLSIPCPEVERIHRSVVKRLNEVVANSSACCLAGAGA